MCPICFDAAERNDCPLCDDYENEILGLPILFNGSCNLNTVTENDYSGWV